VNKPDYSAMAFSITVANGHGIAMSELVAQHPAATVEDWGRVFCSMPYLFDSAPPDDDPPQPLSAVERARLRWVRVLRDLEDDIRF
jgi:hypothetical protein